MKKRLLALAVIIMTTVMSAKASENYSISCYDCTTDWYEGLWIDYSSPQPYTVYDGWNIILKGNQGENIIVCILDMDRKGEIVDGRTYTEADIITDWSGVTMPGSYREDLSQETGIAYTQTHDEDGNLQVTIDMTGESGNTYHVTYSEKCEAIGAVQELTFTDNQVKLMDNTKAPLISNFQIIAEIPGQVSMMIGVNATQLEGEYTISDIIPDYSDITWGNTESGEYSVLKFCDVDMKVTPDPQREGAYYYDITVITKLGYAYHTVLHSTPWTKPDIEITETKTIHAANLRMMDYRDAWGQLLFVASSEDYGLNLYAYSKESQGTFTNRDIDFEYNYVWYYDEEGVERQATAIDGEYTYTEDADGNRSLTGWIDCTNGVKYILDLYYHRADPSRVVTLEGVDGVLEDERSPDGGGIIIQGETESQYILIGIYTPEVEGTYTEQDMDWQTTYIVENTDMGEEDYYMLELLDANVVVTDSGDGENYDVEARMTMQAEQNKNDVVEYIIHMKAYCPHTPSGISSMQNTHPRVKVRKVMRNGRIILTNGQDIYNAEGARLK